MINHARTLLLNISAQQNNLQEPGAEYIPTGFTPVQLTPALTTLRRVLFGTRPDRHFLNMRAQELLSYIHETELAQYLTRLDPRITYWPFSAPFAGSTKATVAVEQEFGAPYLLNVVGSFTANTGLGRAARMFHIALNAGTPNTLTVDYDGIQSQISLSTATPFYLPETNLRCSFAAATGPYDKFAEFADTAISERYLGANQEQAGDLLAWWFVQARAFPAPVITSLIPTLELLGETVFLDLFGVVPAEPYATFKNLWFDHPLPAYRLGGLVLAMIYRMNELRGENNG